MYTRVSIRLIQEEQLRLFSMKRLPVPGWWRLNKEMPANYRR